MPDTLTRPETDSPSTPVTTLMARLARSMNRTAATWQIPVGAFGSLTDVFGPLTDPNPPAASGGVAAPTPRRWERDAVAAVANLGDVTPDPALVVSTTNLAVGVPNVTLFDAVADEIEAHPERYCQGDWDTCIAGTAIRLVTGRRATAQLGSPSVAASRMLGLSSSEAGRLFSASWGPVNGNTVPQALRQIGRVGFKAYMAG